MAQQTSERMTRHRAMIRRALLAVLALALIGTLIFAVRLATSTALWRDPPQPNEPIAGWMTPRYVARSWDVPPEVIAAALALEHDGSGRKITLAELAAQRGTDPATLTAELTLAITAYREQSND